MNHCLQIDDGSGQAVGLLDAVHRVTDGVRKVAIEQEELENAVG